MNTQQTSEQERRRKETLTAKTISKLTRHGYTVLSAKVFLAKPMIEIKGDARLVGGEEITVGTPQNQKLIRASALDGCLVTWRV
ncbi:hypothetical protein [Thaumasiovibrio sp. DFM-14]|uniref:hypothetical protein n=1 Tax=Thaumasiovibrio sp. DFM-14 TaxID=3384792 RepID=UPI0039A1A631